MLRCFQLNVGVETNNTCRAPRKQHVNYCNDSALIRGALSLEISHSLKTTGSGLGAIREKDLGVTPLSGRFCLVASLASHCVGRSF